MATIQENYKYMALPSNIKRGNPIPLDTTAVWYSYEEMAEYARSFPTAYVGQILTLVDKENEYSQAFIILNEAGDLKQVGVLPTPDYASIDIEENDALHLHNWGKRYYHYIPATETEEAYWELQVVDENHPWKEDLQPKVATDEDGELVLEWFEPSSVVIEEVADTIINITEKTEALETNLTQVTNEVTQVTEKVDQHTTSITNLTTEVNEVTEQVNNNTTNVTNLTTQVEEVNTQVISNTENITNLTTEVENINAQVTNNTENITNLTTEVSNLKEDVTELQTVLNETNADLDVLESQLADKANSKDVYTKTESDSKIAEAVAAASHLKRKIFESEAAALLFVAENPDTADQYIYMVPTGLQYDANKYYEYLVVNGVLEQVGNWDIDLSDYCTNDEVVELLKEYYTSEQVDNLLVEYAKSSDLEGYVKINELESYLINFYTAEQVDAKLDTKVDALTTDGRDWLLLSPENQDKLAALVIGDEGVEISGKVNAENVEGLGSWITSNRDNVEGLFPTSALDKLASIEVGAQKNYISSVAEELNVASGILSINSIDASKIVNLESNDVITSLNSIVNTNKNNIASLTDDLNNLSAELNKFVLLETYRAEMDAVKEAVAWHVI